MTTTGLTDDEMRVRIAEACGWSYLRKNKTKASGVYTPGGRLACFYDSRGNDYEGLSWETCFQRKLIPDYLNDLNAMHAAEKSIKCRHTLALYDEYLRREVNPNTDRLAKDWTWEELGRAARADARQRALAFLAMLPEPEAGR